MNNLSIIAYLIISVLIVIFLWAFIALWHRILKAKDKTHKVICKFLGIFLILISVIGFFESYYRPSLILWFCYICIPILSIGIIERNSSLIRSQLYILAIPDLIWSIDFFSFLFRGESLFGITDYVFASTDTLAKITALQHLIVIPIMIYVLLVIRQKSEGAWKISIIQLALVYLLTRIFTKSSENINCVYSFCGRFAGDIPQYYPIIWFSTMMILIYLSRIFLIRIHKNFSI